MQVYRPQPVLSLLIATAAAYWLSVFVYLLQHPVMVARHTFWGSGVFMVAFLASLAYHAKAAIELDATGLTYRGLWRATRFEYSDISRMDVMPGPVTVYVVLAGREAVYFSSFFRRHRELVGLVRERARLAA